MFGSLDVIREHLEVDTNLYCATIFPEHSKTHLQTTGLKSDGFSLKTRERESFDKPIRKKSSSFLSVLRI